MLVVYAAVEEITRRCPLLVASVLALHIKKT
jgi:hypothetical protein